MADTITQPPPPQGQEAALQHQSPFRKWAGLGVITLGLAIVIIDSTLLNVSLSNIIKDLHTDLQSLQWVITGYALVLAAFTITGGRFGDLFGRRKMFMLGAIIFAVGSFLASISHNLTILLLGEAIIEGFGAALMAPATASLVVANFSGKDRATAFGIWGAVAGASSAIGPLLGGYLTSRYSWRWGFRINIFVAALVVVGSLLLLKESKDERKPTIDWWGVVLSAVGLLGITFGIVESSTLGWWKALQPFNIFHHQLTLGSFSIVPLSMLIGLVVLAVFFWWENRMEKAGKTPLVSMDLLKNQQFTSGALTVSILTLAMTGTLFALPVFLQTVKHLDALHTGLALLPMSLAVLIGAPVTGFLSKKIPPKYLIQAGLLVAVVAALVLRATINANVVISHLIPGLILFGLGLGLVFAPVSNLILSAVDVQMSGEASGVNNTLRQVGSTLGAAIIGAAILTSLTGYLVKGVNDSQAIPQNYKAQIIQTVSNPNSNVEFSGAMLPAGVPVIVKQEMQSLVSLSTTRAIKDAFFYSALFAFLGFLVALFLPTTNVHEEEAANAAEKEPKAGAGKFALAGLLAVLAIGGTVWFLHSGSQTIVSTGLVDVQAIRSVFLPPPTPTPTQEQIIIPPVITPTPVAGVSIRGPVPSASPTPVETVYTNSALGFKMQISNLWQANPSSDGTTVVFTNAQGQNITVQAFKNSGETLQDVQSQLQNSPSVTNLRSSNFNGEQAFSFTSNGKTQGLAVIHNNTLYYIFAPSITQFPVSSFGFL